METNCLPLKWNPTSPNILILHLFLEWKCAFPTCGNSYGHWELFPASPLASWTALGALALLIGDISSPRNLKIFPIPLTLVILDLLFRKFNLLFLSLRHWKISSRILLPYIFWTSTTEYLLILNYAIVESLQLGSQTTLSISCVPIVLLKPHRPYTYNLMLGNQWPCSHLCWEKY